MTEPRMVFWHSRRLAKQFHMSRRDVGRILKSIGAKQWADSGCDGGGPVWYWEEGMA